MKRIVEDWESWILRKVLSVLFLFHGTESQNKDGCMDEEVHPLDCKGKGTSSTNFEDEYFMKIYDMGAEQVFTVTVCLQWQWKLY